MEITAKFVERHWPLSRVVISAMPKQGRAGIVGVVSAGEGKYVYKIAGPWKDRTGVENDTAVFDLLNERGFGHITTLLKTCEGKNFVEEDDLFIY